MIDNPRKEKDEISTLSLWKIENIANNLKTQKQGKICKKTIHFS